MWEPPPNRMVVNPPATHGRLTIIADGSRGVNRIFDSALRGAAPGAGCSDSGPGWSQQPLTSRRIRKETGEERFGGT